MTITQVTAEYGRTVNLGNFESERFHLGLVQTVGDGDVPLRLAHDLFVQARDTVEAQMRVEAERRQRERYPIRHGEKPLVDEEDDPTAGGL